MSGLTILGAGSFFNLKWQENKLGSKFEDARPSAETIEFESKYSLRPGDHKDAVFVDFAPSGHMYWLKRE